MQSADLKFLESKGLARPALAMLEKIGQRSQQPRDTDAVRCVLQCLGATPSKLQLQLQNVLGGISYQSDRIGNNGVYFGFFAGEPRCIEHPDLGCLIEFGAINTAPDINVLAADGCLYYEEDTFLVSNPLYQIESDAIEYHASFSHGWRLDVTLDDAAIAALLNNLSNIDRSLESQCVGPKRWVLFGSEILGHIGIQNEASGSKHVVLFSNSETTQSKVRVDLDETIAIKLSMHPFAGRKLRLSRD